MKKKGLLFVGFLFLAGFIILNPLMSSASSIEGDFPKFKEKLVTDPMESLEKNPINVETMLTNSLTGEELPTSIESIEILSTEGNSDGSITETYETVVSLPIPEEDISPEIGPSSVKGGNKTEGHVKAVLTVTYFLNNNKSKIKIRNASGSWEVLKGYNINISNREAAVFDGRPLGKTIRVRPSSNSFNISTNWDYVIYYPGSLWSGARAYSDAHLTVSGMGGSFDLEVFVFIND